MLLLLLKAKSRHDVHTGDLFDAITQVHGYTKTDGTFVRPHAAHRKHAIPAHPVVDVANLSNNGHVNDEGAKVESNADKWVAAFEDAYGDGAADMARWVKDEVLTHGGNLRSIYLPAADFMNKIGGMHRDDFTREVLSLVGPSLKAAGWPGVGTKAAFNAIGDHLRGQWVVKPPGTDLDIAPADGPNPLARPNQRNVPDYLLDRVMAVIEKANKRAAKLGVEGFKVEQGEPYPQERKTDDGHRYFVNIIPLTITGPKIRVPGGWSLLGRVDIEPDGNIINTRPGAEMPVRYRATGSHCEHCNAARDRKSIFVFEDEAGAHKQVGRSCLQDFTGHDPAALLWSAGEYGGIFSDIDGELENDPGVPRAKQLVRLDDVMTAAAYAVREWGFVSRKQSEESAHPIAATSSIVFDLLFDREMAKKYREKVTQADKDKAAAVIEWVRNTYGGKASHEQSDYEYNAATLAAREHVTPNRIGILASLVAAYDRATAERIERAARVNAHVGTVGERRDFDAEFAGENVFETAYGRMYIGRFQTPEGLLVYKGSSPFWEHGLKAGDKIRFTATIADHDDYKGTKQTKISRAKVLAEGEVGVKPKKAKKLIVRTEPLAA